MKKQELLIENNFASNLILEAVGDDKEKKFFMEGIFIQGDVKNHNGRIYPKREIETAVKTLNERLHGGLSVLGEVDHPANLQINLDRVSHNITEMRMEGSDGIGRLRILPTPSGLLIKTFLENDVKLGVSSRGQGEVDSRGNVTGFQIITVDIVAQPSAPSAYPTTIVEALEHYKKYGQLLDVARSADISSPHYDPKAQKYLKKEIEQFFNNHLKLR